jgi:hypothetical protein
VYALTVHRTRSHGAPLRQQPGESSWAPLLSVAMSWEVLATKKKRAWWYIRGEDAMAC